MNPTEIEILEDLSGRILGHYRIVDKIGEGGMGKRHVNETLQDGVCI
jgi:hypothetical protein